METVLHRLAGRKIVTDRKGNGAGTTPGGTLLDTTEELFDQHIAVNLRGPFFTMQAAVKDMRERAVPGSIVNIISTSELGGQPYLAPDRKSVV